MILKRNFSPKKVWGYIKAPMYWALSWSLLAWAAFYFLKVPQLAISFTPIGVLGSALAIFVAFRNNSAYSRWWEARRIWEELQNATRVLARLVITFTDSHAHQDGYDPERSARFKQRMVYRAIAWAHVLRLQLRVQEDWPLLKRYLESEECEQLRQAVNKPNYLQLLIGKDIYEAMGNGTLGGFDSFQMEGQLLALSRQQGAAERIKNTPLPRQYDFFTRIFVWLFISLLPFGLFSFFPIESGLFSVLSVFLSVLIAAVFVVLERTGAANEDPFENKVTDVPLSAICNSIERDLLELLGEPLPKKLSAESGYLF